MVRGTTPTFTFTLPIACWQITAMNICFAQQGQVILEKELIDCTLGDNTVCVRLTEAETLLFDSQKGMVEIQLRVGCGDIRMASKIMYVSVERILKEGCLL